MSELNPEHGKIILRLINNCPYFRLLKMEVIEIGMSYSKLEINIDSNHLNPFGGVHGGVYSSIIDTAAYWAVYCELNEDIGLISMDLYVNNLAPINKGKLTVKGARIKIGQTICLAEAVVFNEDGKCIAHGISKMLITKNLQTIIQAFKYTDCKILQIPPKFI